MHLLIFLCSYPYAGHVSSNISRLHASLAHFDTNKDEFQARIVYVNSYADVADMIRNIGELTHQLDTVSAQDRSCTRDTKLHCLNRFGVLVIGQIALGSALIQSVR